MSEQFKITRFTDDEVDELFKFYRRFNQNDLIFKVIELESMENLREVLNEQ